MSHHKHYVGGRMNAVSGAVARNVAAQLWNPHASRRIEVSEIWIAATTATTAANIAIARTTTRGTTPGASTVTPDLDNNIARDSVNPSGMLLDFPTFSAMPTVDASDLARWNLPAVIGAGVILPFGEGIVIPPGTGLAIITAIAVAFPICDVTFVVED